MRRQNKPQQYTIFYFGCDTTWQEIKLKGATRRNTCIVQALNASSFTSKVFVIQKTTRASWLKWFLTKSLTQEKTIDFYYCTLLPQQLINRGFEQTENKLQSLILRLLTKSVSRGTIKVKWGYWPNGFELAEKFHLDGLFIFDADHNIVDDPNLAPEDKGKQVILLRRAADKCNFILSSVRSMIRWYLSEGYNNCIRVRNGIDLSRFTIYNSEKDYSTQKIVVGYCGTLSAWIDYDLFSQLITRNPDWHFVIIGKPYKSDGFRKLKAPNVTFTGYKQAEEAAALIKTFDVALNLYLQNPALDVDSMKLYEYLASDIPVISTQFHPGLKSDFEDLLILVNTVNEIESAIKELCSGNRQINKENLCSFLKRSTWKSRIDDFFTGMTA